MTSHTVGLSLVTAMHTQNLQWYCITERDKQINLLLTQSVFLYEQPFILAAWLKFIKFSEQNKGILVIFYMILQNQVIILQTVSLCLQNVIILNIGPLYKVYYFIDLWDSIFRKNIKTLLICNFFKFYGNQIV